MGNGMNKVLPGLYVGNYRDSKDHQQLEKFKITHIIAIHDSPRRLLPDKHYLCVMASDTPDQNLSQYFSVCNDFIHAARLRERNVLIHCLAGMSRSVTVAVAYIMTATHLNWKEALKVVRAGRAVANPNAGFQTQLLEFEQYKLTDERRRLRERFPSSALEQLDRIKCGMALDNYQELLQNRDICEGNCSRGEKCPTGVCNMDPSKGLFRRRPSTASTHSRLRAQSSNSSTGTSSSTLGVGSSASVSGVAALSCPTSPKHSPLTRRSVGNERIPEDEDDGFEQSTATPTTSSEAAEYAAAFEDARREQRQQQQQYQQQQQQRQRYKEQQQQQKQQKQQPQQQQQNPLQRSPSRQSYKSAGRGNSTTGTGRVSSAGSRRETSSDEGDGGGAQLQRSSSTVSGFGVRPRSSPAGLHAYTGSVPSSVQGSRVDLRDIDKGSAIYLGCSGPRASTLSISSSRGSSGGSAPPSPCHTPPSSPARQAFRRSTSVVKKTR